MPTRGVFVAGQAGAAGASGAVEAHGLHALERRPVDDGFVKALGLVAPLGDPYAPRVGDVLQHLVAEGKCRQLDRGIAPGNRLDVCGEWALTVGVYFPPTQDVTHIPSQIVTLRLLLFRPICGCMASGRWRVSQAMVLG